MKKLMTLAGAALMVVVLSACTSTPHSDSTMATGIHVMPGPKAGTMSDRVMPARSADCTEEALAKMPPEHRQVCENCTEEALAKMPPDHRQICEKGPTHSSN